MGETQNELLAPMIHIYFNQISRSTYENVDTLDTSNVEIKVKEFRTRPSTVHMDSEMDIICLIN